LSPVLDGLSNTGKEVLIKQSTFQEEIHCDIRREKKYAPSEVLKSGEFIVSEPVFIPN
jgi:hypothetical protein